MLTPRKKAPAPEIEIFENESPAAPPPDEHAPEGAEIPQALDTIEKSLEGIDELNAKIDAAVERLYPLSRGPFRLRGRLAGLMRSRKAKKPILKWFPDPVK